MSIPSFAPKQPHSRLRRRRFMVQLLFVFAWACGASQDDVKVSVRRAPDSASATAGTVARRYASFRLDTVNWSGRDSALRSSDKVLASNSQFVFQIGTAQLRSVNLSGRLLWSVDVSKYGLNRISDYRVVTDSVFVHDGETNQILILGPRGIPADTVSLSNLSRVDVFVPQSDGRIFAVVSDSIQPAVLIDRNGVIASRADVPWPGFAKMSTLARQGTIAFDPKSRSWAFGFYFGSGFLVYDGTTARPFRGTFVEPVSFPDVIVTRRGTFDRSERLGRTTTSASSMTLHNGELVVLFGGTTDSLKYRVLDRYRLTDGQYAGSYLLARQAHSVTTSGNRLFVQFPNALTRLVSGQP